jgi:glucose-6-phosphate 1-dehydrogenase
LREKFCVVGVARHPMSNEALRESLMKGLRQFATRPVGDKVANRLLECVASVAADSGAALSFDRRKEQLERLEATQYRGESVILFSDTALCFRDDRAPARSCRLVERRSRRLATAGGGKADWHRPGVAHALNTELLNIRNEHQICRIDDYLGKEKVQSILVLLFANGMFEKRGAEPPVSAIIADRDGASDTFRRT